LNDEKLITCGEDKQICISNPITDKFFAISPNHKGAIRTMTLSSDKNYLFSTGDQLEVNVWLVEGWTLLCSLIILDQSLDYA
jgi:WD40 repeat protein